MQYKEYKPTDLNGSLDEIADEFVKQSIPEQASEATRSNMRKAFLAGFGACSMMTFTNLHEMSVIDFLSRVDEMKDEVLNFTKKNNENINKKISGN